MLNLNFPNQISKKFISLYPNFFNSKAYWGRFERHHRLGEKEINFLKSIKKNLLRVF